MVRCSEEGVVRCSMFERCVRVLQRPSLLCLTMGPPVSQGASQLERHFSGYSFDAVVKRVTRLRVRELTTTKTPDRKKIHIAKQ